MGLLFKLKRNPRLRGIYCLYKNYIGFSRKDFGYIAKDVFLCPPISMDNPKNVFLYGDNGLTNAIIMTTNARFIMKPHSGAAEGLRVTTGNHERIVGRFYRTIKEEEKTQGLDKDIVVESDVWIGRNVILLSGITIGRGATVAAGAVVSRSMPPYCVCGGVPARVIKFYWTVDEILEHEEKLYPEEERYSREELEEIMAKYKNIIIETR